MQSRLRIPLTLAFIATAALALATEEDPVPTVQSIEVGVEKPLPETVIEPRLTAEEKALYAIRDEGQEAVAALTAQLPGQVTDQGRVEIQKQLEAAKQANRIEMLRKIIEFADAAGDEEKAGEARRILDLAMNRSPTPPRTVDRPAPVQTQGGE